MERFNPRPDLEPNSRWKSNPNWKSNKIKQRLSIPGEQYDELEKQAKIENKDISVMATEYISRLQNIEEWEFIKNENRKPIEFILTKDIYDKIKEISKKDNMQVHAAMRQHCKNILRKNSCQN